MIAPRENRRWPWEERPGVGQLMRPRTMVAGPGATDEAAFGRWGAANEVPLRELDRPEARRYFERGPDVGGVAREWASRAEAGAPVGRLREQDTAMGGRAAAFMEGEADWNRNGIPDGAEMSRTTTLQGPSGESVKETAKWMHATQRQQDPMTGAWGDVRTPTFSAPATMSPEQARRHRMMTGLEAPGGPETGSKQWMEEEQAVASKMAGNRMRSGGERKYWAQVQDFLGKRLEGQEVRAGEVEKLRESTRGQIGQAAATAAGRVAEARTQEAGATARAQLAEQGLNERLSVTEGGLAQRQREQLASEERRSREETARVLGMKPAYQTPDGSRLGVLDPATQTYKWMPMRKDGERSLVQKPDGTWQFVEQITGTSNLSDIPVWGRDRGAPAAATGGGTNASAQSLNQWFGEMMGR